MSFGFVYAVDCRPSMSCTGETVEPGQPKTAKQKTAWALTLDESSPTSLNSALQGAAVSATERSLLRCGGKCIKTSSSRRGGVVRPMDSAVNQAITKRWVPSTTTCLCSLYSYVWQRHIRSMNDHYMEFISCIHAMIPVGSHCNLMVKVLRRSFWWTIRVVLSA